MESCRLLSTKPVDTSNAWSPGDAGEGVSMFYPSQPGPPVVAQSQTLTLNNLPTHTMLSVQVNVEDGSVSTQLGDTDKLVVTIDGVSQTLTRSRSTDGTLTSVWSGGYNHGQWIAHSGSSLTVTAEAQDMEPDEGSFGVAATVRVYEPTITASGGGGDMTEAGAGSGSATFTVSRDLPAGWLGTPGGDDPVPDTTVTVSRGGTATFGVDYQHATGSADLPDGSVTFSNSQISKSFTVVPIDDSVAEPATPPVTGPIEAETVTWTVTIPDVVPPSAPMVTLSAGIVDDSSWHYSAWEITGQPQNFPAQYLGRETHFGENHLLEITNTYYLVSEWRFLGIADISDEFGAPATYSEHLNWTSTVTYGWNAGGTATINLAQWIPFSVNITGGVKQDYTVAKGGSVDVPNTVAGEANTLKYNAAYALFQYIRVITVFDGEDNEPATPIEYNHEEVGQEDHPLGYTGEISKSYTSALHRYWLDEEDSRVANASLSLSTPSTPTVIRCSNYPE